MREETNETLFDYSVLYLVDVFTDNYLCLYRIGTVTTDF